ATCLRAHLFTVAAPATPHQWNSDSGPDTTSSGEEGRQSMAWTIGTDNCLASDCRFANAKNTPSIMAKLLSATLMAYSLPATRAATRAAHASPPWQAGSLSFA